MKEKYLQRAVAAYLAGRRFEQGDLQYCHVPNETPLGTRFEQTEKKRAGVVAGAPDFVIWYPGGVLALELKSKRGRLGDTQKRFRDRLDSIGHDYVMIRGAAPEEVVRSVDTLLNYLIAQSSNETLSLPD